jgi:hypothetical protein
MNVYTLNTRYGILYYEVLRASVLLLCYGILTRYVLQIPLPEQYKQHVFSIMISVIVYHCMIDPRVKVQVVSDTHRDNIKNITV